MGCVIIFLFRTLLFAEIFSHDINSNLNLKFLFLTPFYSRLGMGFLLNNLKFAKSDGLAALLGVSRKKNDNIFFIIIFIILFFMSAKIIFIIFILSLIIWKNLCLKIFGGITGDLLGAFVEISEILILTGTVIDFCI